MDKIKASTFADLAYFSRFKPPSRLVTFAAPASTLTNFPALVKCNSTFNIGTSTGYDVHFQDLSGNELPYELDYYDSVTGNGAWWVKIPSLPSSGPTSIKMLYGDSSASTNGSTPLTVWSDFLAVYHFNELSGTSQTNRADGVQSAANFGSNVTYQTASQGTGRLLRCAYNGNANDITQGLTTVMTPTSEVCTITLMCKNRATPRTTRGLLSLGAFNGISSGTLYATGGGLLVFGSTGENWNLGVYPHSCSATTSSSTEGISIYNAAYVEASATGRCAQINNNTPKIGNGWVGSNPTASFTTFNSLISGWDANWQFDVDEIRFCKSAHSQDWMNYEYSNYIDHSNNVTYGPEV